MKKRFLSTLLVSAMLATTLLAGCGQKTQDPTPTPETTTTPETTKEPETPQGEALPEAKYYFSFDGADATKGVHSAQKGAGAIDLIEKDVKTMKGVKGNALYADGISGYKLDVNGVGDTYTISYWMYATRFANYMPTIQFGPDVHGDATGSQHYVNITRAEWGGSPSFPCVWAYDQADNGLWPNWFNANDLTEHLKEWLHIVLVVDANKLSEDGNCLAADLYVNGQLFGENISVVNGAMSPSDNFDFLLGVNYWDATFKGAFDEVYVFDKALTAGQVATLYKDGDVNAKFEEPARIIEVKKADNAIASLGAIDFSVADAVYDVNTTMTDGHTVTYKLKHWSDGKDAKNNYYFLFKDAEGNVVARLNADMTGTVNGKDMADTCFNYSWGNWNTWEKSVMVEATVKAVIERKGNDFVVKISNVDYNGTDNTCEAKFTVENVATVTVGTVNAYTDILSVSDQAPVEGTVLGATDLSQGWWQVFSNPVYVPNGQSKTIKFKNFAGSANYNNFICVLTGSAMDPSNVGKEGYIEYAVVRADNWGWTPAGDLADANKEHSWGDDWATWLADMDGASVELTVTNEGSTAKVEAKITAVNGTVYTVLYKDLAITGELYFSLGVDHSYIVIDPVTLGATDLSQGWWQVFTDVYYVGKDTSKTVTFKNFAGAANYNNFIAVLLGAEKNPTNVGKEGYVEYAVVRADNWGWTAAGDLADANKEHSWGDDWATWLADMDGATVELTVSNVGGTTATVEAKITAVNGNVYTVKYKDLTINDSLYFSLGVDHSYIVY